MYFVHIFNVLQKSIFFLKEERVRERKTRILTTVVFQYFWLLLEDIVYTTKLVTRLSGKPKCIVYISKGDLLDLFSKVGVDRLVRTQTIDTGRRANKLAVNIVCIL